MSDDKKVDFSVSSSSEWKEIPEYRTEIVRDRNHKVQKAFPNGRYTTNLQEQARTVLHKMLDTSPVEQFVVLLVNHEYEILGAERVAVGDLDHVEIPMRSIFRAAITAGAPRVILCHCHPTGAAKPSDDDLWTTMVAVEVGAVLGVEVVDHMIISPDGSDFSIFDNQHLIREMINRKTQSLMTGHPIGQLIQGFINDMKREAQNQGKNKMPSLSRENPRTMREDIIQEVAGVKPPKRGRFGN